MAAATHHESLAAHVGEIVKQRAAAAASSSISTSMSATTTATATAAPTSSVIMAIFCLFVAFLVILTLSFVRWRSCRR
jgi:hypothetical protein